MRYSGIANRSGGLAHHLRVTKHIIELPGLVDIIEYLNASLDPDTPLGIGDVLRLRDPKTQKESVSVHQVPVKVANVINALLSVLFGIEEEVMDDGELDEVVLHYGRQYIQDIDTSDLYAILGNRRGLVIKSIQLADSYGSVTIEL